MEGEEVEVMEGLEVLLFPVDLDPTQSAPQVPFQSVSLTCSADEVVEDGYLTGRSLQVAEESWLGHESNNPDVE